MLVKIAYFMVFGVPFINVLGILTFLSLLFTGLFSYLNRKGKLGLSWHKNAAILTFIFAILHAGLALFINF